MTNTYKEDAKWEEKVLEELRCTRCVLERLLRVFDEGLFVDYQLEKFSPAKKANLKEILDKHGSVRDYLLSLGPFKDVEV